MKDFIEQYKQEMQRLINEMKVIFDNYVKETKENGRNIDYK